MGKESVQKGNALEDAVRTIETAILRARPDFSDKTLVVEGKKHVVVSGVRHEVDIYVTVKVGAGYDASFIFECKNRLDKADKNDVIVFAEKLRVFRAQRGFFVAKQFTADARAQAALEPRIELLDATELNPSSLPLPCEGRFAAFTEIALAVVYRNDEFVHVPIGLDTTSFELDGQPRPLRGYMDDWARDLIGPAMTDTAAATTLATTIEQTDERLFDEGKVRLGGREVRGLRLTCKTHLKPILTHRVVSSFEVASRGRVTNVEMVAENMTMTICAIDVARHHRT
jgi:Restriction endonuclease